MPAIKVTSNVRVGSSLKGKLAEIVVSKVSRGMLADVNRFADELTTKVKEGYANSKSYRIREVSDVWAERRGDANNKKALFWTGFLMRNIVHSEVKFVRKGGNGNRGGTFSFRVYPKNVKQPGANGGKSTSIQIIAEYLEKNGRPLWARVSKRHLPKLRDKVLQDLRNRFRN